MRELRMQPRAGGRGCALPAGLKLAKRERAELAAKEATKPRDSSALTRLRSDSSGSAS